MLRVTCHRAGMLEHSVGHVLTPHCTVRCQNVRLRSTALTHSTALRSTQLSLPCRTRCLSPEQLKLAGGSALTPIISEQASMRLESISARHTDEGRANER